MLSINRIKIYKRGVKGSSSSWTFNFIFARRRIPAGVFSFETLNKILHLGCIFNRRCETAITLITLRTRVRGGDSLINSREMDKPKYNAFIHIQKYNEESCNYKLKLNVASCKQINVNSKNDDDPPGICCSLVVGSSVAPTQQHLTEFACLPSVQVIIRIILIILYGIIFHIIPASRSAEQQRIKSESTSSPHNNNVHIGKE